MKKAPNQLITQAEKVMYNSKEQWLIDCLHNVGIDVEGVVARRLERLETALDIGEKTNLRYIIIASIIAQHNIKLNKLPNGPLEYLIIEGRVVSIWNNILNIAFKVEEA